MKNITKLKERGLLTEQQVLHAHQFARNPNAYSLAPTFHRILHDAIIMEEPLEAMEKRRGWPARSAKAIIGMILHAMQEVHGSQRDIGDMETVDHLRAVIKHLTADDIQARGELMTVFGLTATEARVFLILQRSPGRMCSAERIIDRLAYSDDREVSRSTLTVMISRIRTKMADASWHIETIHGEGYQLVEAVRRVDEEV